MSMNETNAPKIGGRVAIFHGDLLVQAEVLSTNPQNTRADLLLLESGEILLDWPSKDTFPLLDVEVIPC